MARTTNTPHKVSRNKSGSPIVRASKLFPGRPKRTTRELAFETERQARLFADALNLAAIRDGDWRWLKREDWTAQLRCVGEVQRMRTVECRERLGGGAQVLLSEGGVMAAESWSHTV
jgi:hypothetical protein